MLQMWQTWPYCHVLQGFLGRRAPLVGSRACQLHGGSRGIRPGGYTGGSQYRFRQENRPWNRAQSLENHPRVGRVPVTPNHHEVITHTHTHTGVCRRRKLGGHTHVSRTGVVVGSNPVNVICTTHGVKWI